jgi:Domain of unknown function (DUF4760)
MNEVGAVFVTGGFASLIAIWGVLSQRVITRRQVTLDHIAHLESDRDIIEARKLFVELAKEPGGLAKWAEADQEQTTQALAIGRILNSYELISIGIQRGIIDYELLKRWHRASAIKYWERGGPFVMRIRERLGNDMFFHEFEQMTRWLKGDKKPPKRRPGTFF